MQLLLLVIALFVASCARTVGFEETYQLKVPEQKISVRLDDKLRSLEETMSAALGSETGTYKVGKALSYVFENDPSASISIRYISSHLDHIMNPGGWFLSPVVQAEYRLTVIVETTGRKEIVEVTGKGNSYLNSYNAYQDAMEKAVILLHQKLVALLSKG